MALPIVVCSSSKFIAGGWPPRLMNTLCLSPFHHQLPASPLFCISLHSNCGRNSSIVQSKHYSRHVFPYPSVISKLSASENDGAITRVSSSDNIGETTRDAEEENDSDSDVESADVGPSSSSPARWDVLGLAQAMVDFSGMVDDDFLNKLGLEKGSRKVVNHEERGRVLRAMDGCSYKAAAGGSLSNTLVAMARLGSQLVGGPALNIAMAGSVGSDPLGGFYRSKLRRANLNFVLPPVDEATTGTVIVLTTPDAQRTMLAYQGTSSSISYYSCLASAIQKTSILVVEGYLFELPDTIQTIIRACKDARNSGALVAITASDTSCIERHYDDFWEILLSYADVVFTNSDEARALCHFSSKDNPVSAMRYLSHFVPLVSVTDGPRGSFIGSKGEAIYIPPSPCTPVDTCGAGDAYAAGFLYGVSRGIKDFKDLGSLAAKVAAVVVAQRGTRLRVEDAAALAMDFVKASPNMPSSCSSDVGSDQISSI